MSQEGGVLTGPLASHLRKGGKKPGFNKGELAIVGEHQERQNQNSLSKELLDWPGTFTSPRGNGAAKEKFSPASSMFNLVFGTDLNLSHCGTAVQRHSWPIFPSSRVSSSSICICVKNESCFLLT